MLHNVTLRLANGFTNWRPSLFAPETIRFLSGTPYASCLYFLSTWRLNGYPEKLFGQKATLGQSQSHQSQTYHPHNKKEEQKNMHQTVSNLFGGYMPPSKYDKD